MEPQTNKLTVPIAIIIAGAIIGGAVLLSNTKIERAPEKKAPSEEPQVGTAKVKPVSGSDHILGNPNAEVFMIEYSDLECPFCKVFHPTMHRIVDEYGKTGKVAWVYRHFPLYKGSPPLHSKAGEEAEASECAAELGGNTKFWAYVDKIFAVTPSNNQLDLKKLPDFAVEIGLDQKAFEKCLSSNKYESFIEQAYNDALTAGARGTPHNILVTKNGKQVELQGAQPYEAVKQAIDNLLAGQ